jgi:hypothetical protein
MSEWWDRYGSAGVGSGALWVGDKLDGRPARLWARVEAVGWLLVVRVAPRLYPCVCAQSRWRALGRLAAYGWALQERSRIEPVFGRVKGAYGSYRGCRREAYVMVRVWGQLVLWKGAVFACWGWWCFLLCVGCDGCVVWGWKGNFRTPSPYPLTNAPEMG